jgi:hypothetical protein
LLDFCQHRADIFPNLLVAETNNLDASALQPISPNEILSGYEFVIVNRAIDFNGEPNGWNIKIENKPTDGILPAYSRSANLPIPQKFPQPLFRSRLTLAKVPGSIGIFPMYFPKAPQNYLLISLGSLSKST